MHILQGASEAHKAQKRTDNGGKEKGTRGKKNKPFAFKAKGKEGGKGKSL